MSETITATALARNLSDILNRVQYRNERFVVERNGSPVAVVEPLPPVAPVTLRDVIEKIGDLSMPGDGFADAVEAAVAAQRPVEKTALAILIDSTVFVTMERRGLSLRRLTDTFDEPVGLSTIALSELLTGVWRADTPERKTTREQFIEAIISAFPIVPFDLKSARIHAQLWAALDAAGRPIGERDLLISATALAHGYDVLTDNTREYGRIPELIVRRPDWSTLTE